MNTKQYNNKFPKAAIKYSIIISIKNNNMSRAAFDHIEAKSIRWRL